uniref:Uncharacterized protein n=1 Tax=Virus NIOZ-UU159 TaxID=2763270 RepID=A0A7S9ST14_9VIRU|nr:MAG: hypothetical protein NIOZUU159_00150 [Virus NIOZ-UU159]|tara:strand:- start:277 stop:594 length:318 start_codon:yes stop_codon:yes gene_type:complete
MKLNLLYDELYDIILNKNDDLIKMLSFESSTNRSLVAAFEGIYNTIKIIILNNKFDIAIDEYFNNGTSKKILLKKNNVNIIINYNLNESENIFTIITLYCNNINY